MIDAQKIKELVSHTLDVIIYDVTDSTNTRAKEYAAEAKGPTLFIAREQSAGRGRLGRSFLSRADSGIYMSLLYFTEDSLTDAVSVTTAAAVYVAEAIEQVTGEKMLIKWVNDVYSDRGKVCGILTESVKVGDRFAIIVGIGINVGEIDFPPELCGIAASVGDVDGRESEIIAAVSDKLMFQASHPESRAYMSGYRRRFMLDGKRVLLYRGGELEGEGQVLGVDDDGGLIFLPDGESIPITIRTGEVTLRLNR